MNVPSKTPLVFKPAPPKLSAPPVYRPAQAAKQNLQLKRVSDFKVEKRPAPPVYRPQPTSPSGSPAFGRGDPVRTTISTSGIQRALIPANKNVTRQFGPLPLRLAAPPIYRPNQVSAPSAQLKPANNFRLETRPAPPVYRPEQVQSGVQPKLANGFRVKKRPMPEVPRPTTSAPVDRFGIQARSMAPAITSKSTTARGQRLAAPVPVTVLQRSCCLSSCWPWGSSNRATPQTAEEQEELVPKAQPLEDDKPIPLDEGKSQMVKPGDKVLNRGVTSCGLVLAFGSEGILAYHWPFMSLEHRDHFSRLLEGVGTLNKIEIYTNPIPLTSKSQYQQTLRYIRYNYTKRTRHYIYGTELKGDVTVTLKADGVERCNPPVTDELPPE
jgi:hypothetical protein